MQTNYKDVLPSDGPNLRKNFEKDAKKYRQNNQQIPHKSDDFIRLFSYNVHYWTDIESKSITYHDTMKKISFLDPDLISLQEVLIPNDGETDSFGLDYTIKDTFKPLSKYNVESIGVSKVMSTRKTLFGNVIASKFPIDKINHIYFHTGSNKEVRGAIMYIVYPPYGKPFLYINTHLDVWDDTGEIRRGQLLELFESIDKNYPKNISVVLTGDFNSLKSEDYSDDELKKLNGDFETIKYIEMNGFVDVFDKLKYTVWSGRRVDYIFIRNFYKEIVGSYIYYDNLSDHFSLIVDIS